MTTGIEPAAGAAEGAVTAIPGLRIRHATTADWPALTDVVNRSRRADGMDEVHTADSWANEWPESEMFQLERRFSTLLCSRRWRGRLSSTRR